MLTWMGFVGKLIELILNKVVGKKLDLTLDEKKKAAKAFFRFHEAVVELEIILDHFLSYIESFVQGRNSNIHRVHLDSATRNLESASSEFLSSLKELGKVLYFFDRNLAALFAYINYSKRGVLRNIYLFFAESSEQEIENEYHRRYLFEDSRELSELRSNHTAKFKAIEVNKYLRAIEYTIPTDTLMNIDLNEQLDQISRQANESHFNPLNDPSDPRNVFSLFGYDDEAHWSVLREYQNMVVNIIMNNIEEGYIDYAEKDKLIALYPKLKAHRELLDQAREKLSTFIQQQFSVADLLYVIRK